MARVGLFLFATTLVFLAANTATKTLNLSTDKSSLTALKPYIASDPNNMLARGWSDSTPVCNWTGVTCHGSPLRVIGLNLSYAGLVGIVPPNLGNLSFLVHLSFGNNSFHGALPSELSRLSRLRTMDFGFNALTGRFPTWLGSLSGLESLLLLGNRLSGSIPTAIFNLTSLRIINLSNNLLSGEIPQEIGNLRQLEKLSLQRNSLSGPLPRSLFNMSSLKFMVLFENRFIDRLPDNLCQRLPAIQGLDVSGNRLSGQIPSKLWQCKELYFLGLDSNELSGEIPRNIGNLTSLRRLHLSNNTLSGTIPEEIGKLHNLQVLALNGNEISGIIPPSLFNITTLEAIVLYANPLSGGLPPNLGLTAFNLKALLLFNNQLTGPLPKSISNASQLTTLEISHNRFSGSIPDLSALTNLEWLNLEDNDFTVGSDDIFSAMSAMRKLRVCALTFNPLNVTLPASFGSNISDSLQQLDLALCDLSGHIPATLANLSSLILLSLAKNKFSGQIPVSIGRLERLQVLHLNRNQLRGSIPLEICQLKNLFRLQLHQNMISGSIPSCFANIGASLRYLNLGSNRLTSTIPISIWGLDYLLGIDLSSNSLVGSLSSDVGNLKVATYFDVSNNQLSGDISKRIGELNDVAYMSLANNRFAGSIPDSLGNLLGLLVLDLSNNSLTGEIPKSLEKLLKLKALNLSFNDLHGVIPSGGPFWNFSSQSFMRNHALCGSPRLQVPSCKIASRKGDKARILRIVIPCIIAALVLAVLFVIVIFRKKRNTNPDAEAALVSRRGISRFELLAGTNGFSEENLLGKGSFGSVYKGTLSDGLAVAVKVFNWASEEAFASFERECEVLSNIRHRNLVKVITCCSSPDFKALVLEYMAQGSLEERLYSDDHGLSPLNISQRLSIAIDVASAMEYLHHGYSTPIVHCDLKPSNVLLDEDMVAHVADFGIAKLLYEQNSMTQTMTLATIGYMAPEYGASGAVSRKGDVYSFGIMLMEIFTRKKPVDEMFSEEMSFRQWVENSVPHSISEVIEAGLLRRDDTAMKECVSSLMELGLACCASAPEQRLHINTVASTLRKINNKYF